MRRIFGLAKSFSLFCLLIVNCNLISPSTANAQPSTLQSIDDCLNYYRDRGQPLFGEKVCVETPKYIGKVKEEVSKRKPEIQSLLHEMQAPGFIPEKGQYHMGTTPEDVTKGAVSEFKWMVDHPTNLIKTIPIPIGACLRFGRFGKPTPAILHQYSYPVAFWEFSENQGQSRYFLRTLYEPSLKNSNKALRDFIGKKGQAEKNALDALDSNSNFSYEDTGFINVSQGGATYMEQHGGKSWFEYTFGPAFRSLPELGAVHPDKASYILSKISGGGNVDVSLLFPPFTPFGASDLAPLSIIERLGISLVSQPNPVALKPYRCLAYNLKQGDTPKDMYVGTSWQNKLIDPSLRTDDCLPHNQGSIDPVKDFAQVENIRTASEASLKKGIKLFNALPFPLSTSSLAVFKALEEKDCFEWIEDDVMYKKWGGQCLSLSEVSHKWEDYELSQYGRSTVAKAPVVVLLHWKFFRGCDATHDYPIVFGFDAGKQVYCGDKYVSKRSKDKC